MGWLGGEGVGVGLGDVARGLGVGRAGLECRVGVVAGSREELVERLGGVVEGGVVSVGSGLGGLAFMFTGQGAQWVGMGRGLYGVFPVFAEVFDGVCGEFDRLLGGCLRDVCWGVDGGGGLLDRTEFTQPALFAFEVALFRLLESWGVVPGFLIGHSVGELVAAYVAGVFSLGDACVVVAARGRLMGGLPGGGGMLAVGASLGVVEGFLEGFGGRLSVAAVNGPRSVVVSGEVGVLEEFEGGLGGVPAVWLRVSHAFHSGLMDPVLEEFRRVVEGVELGVPRLPVVSNVTGGVLSGEQAVDPGYWVSQLRESVRFADGVGCLVGLGVGGFVEVGPASVLAGLAGQCLEELGGGFEGVGGRVFGCGVGASGDELAGVWEGLVGLWSAGVGVDWRVVFGGGSSARVGLPTYPFERERYWLEPGGVGDVSQVGLGVAEHPLLGAVVGVAGEERWLFTGRVSLGGQGWLADHAVHGVVILPGTAFLELGLWVGARLGCGVVSELVLEVPLVVGGSGAVEVQVVVEPGSEAGRRAFSVFSRSVDGVGMEEGVEAGWVRHAEGVLAEERLGEVGGVGGLVGEQWPPVGARVVGVEGLYERLGEVGFGYGPVFGGWWGRGGGGMRCFVRCCWVGGSRRVMGFVCIRRCWMRRFMG